MHPDFQKLITLSSKFYSYFAIYVCDIYFVDIWSQKLIHKDGWVLFNARFDHISTKNRKPKPLQDLRLIAQCAYHCCEMSQTVKVLKSKSVFERELSAPCTSFHIDTSTCSHRDLPLNPSVVTSQWLSSDNATGHHHEATSCWSGGSVDIIQPVYCIHNEFKIS
jgi:hypothetical protein